MAKLTTVRMSKGCGCSVTCPKCEDADNLKFFVSGKALIYLLQFKRPHHRIRIHRRATRVGAFEVFEAAHVALRTLLAFSQPVNCIFSPIGMLNWLVAASKLHKHRETCCTAEWPFYSFLILCTAPFRTTDRTVILISKKIIGR